MKKMLKLQKKFGLIYLLINILGLIALKDGIIILVGIIPALILICSKKVIIDL